MKNCIRHTLFLCIALLGMAKATAQTRYAVYNFQNNGKFHSFLQIDIDSITFSRIDLEGNVHDDMVVQEVWTADSLYRIPLDVIDSIAFKKQEADVDVPLQEQVVELQLPEELQDVDATEYVLSTPYGDFEFDGEVPAGSARKGMARNGSAGASAVTQFPNKGIMLVTMINKKTGWPLMSMIQSPFENGFLPKDTLNVEKTAIAKLMLTPELMTDDPVAYRRIVSILKTLPQFGEFKEKIRAELVRAHANKQCPTLDNISCNGVLLAYLSKSFDNSNLTQNGMHLEDLRRDNGTISFRLSNDYKRVVHLYPKRVWMDDKNFSVVREEYVDGLMMALEPQAMSYWKTVWGSVTGDRSSIYKSTSELMTVDLGDADKLCLDVYGIGQPEQPFDTYSEDEQLRMVMAMIHGGCNDFVLPFVNLLLGVGDAAGATGSDSHRYDFRYGSRKSPMWSLVNKLAVEYVKDPKRPLQLFNDLKEKKWAQALGSVGSFCMDQILGNAQTGVGADYLNYIYNMGKKYSKVSKTSDAFRTRIKSLANNVSYLQKANFVGKVIKVTEMGADVAGAIYALYNTKSHTRYNINASDKTELTLVRPAQEAVLDNTNVTFEWDIAMGNVVGQVAYDLKLYFYEGDECLTRTYSGLTNKTFTVNLSTVQEYAGSKTVKWEVIARHHKNQQHVYAKSELRSFTIRSQESLLKERTFSVNGVSFTLVGVEGGTFQMGATPEHELYAGSGEYPVHEVTLSSFYIGKLEVTQELWEEVMGENPSQYKDAKMPLHNATWNECKVFINTLNGKTGMNFRMPTEAEWEYAARGGRKYNHNKYAGGVKIDDLAWYYDNSGDKPHEGGQKKPNELGLYDMSGNVFEWCSDWYGTYPSEAQTNPQGPGEGSERVLRGGCWNASSGGCRTATRYAYDQGIYYRRVYNGLRLALSVE
ncbi:MAG: formylglycine-generating enzyme family protein [Prevotella sp.]|nr:formylglycine-generating enzyme family protein [Prevotella sp.]